MLHVHDNDRTAAISDFMLAFCLITVSTTMFPGSASDLDCNYMICVPSCNSLNPVSFSLDERTIMALMIGGVCKVCSVVASGFAERKLALE